MRVYGLLCVVCTEFVFLVWLWSFRVRIYTIGTIACTDNILCITTFFYCLCRFWKLPNVFFFCMRYSLSCPFQCLNFLRKFTQLEYLLLFRNLLISNAYVADSVLSTCHMFFYCPRVLQDIHFSCLLSFHCLHFLHRFTLSEYFAVFINLFIAICCMQHIHYALLFFYRQHHFW